MKNFIFISPNFPTNYWQFCRPRMVEGDIEPLDSGEPLYGCAGIGYHYQ